VDIAGMYISDFHNGYSILDLVLIPFFLPQNPLLGKKISFHIIMGKEITASEIT